jgi:uncharacterized protein (TIGR03382 family)
MVGSVLSDELWSTPLFQSLQSLIAAGRTRQEVDRVILDAHFGLGANVKMPQMATAILQSAKELYPSGPHEATFKTQFTTMKILTEPAPSRSSGGGGGGSWPLLLWPLLLLGFLRRR